MIPQGVSQQKLISFAVVEGGNEPAANKFHVIALYQNKSSVSNRSESKATRVLDNYI
jgi:hypothetical protein